MNLFLHGIGEMDGDSPISSDDSLVAPSARKVDLVLANPPFGKKSTMTITNAEGEAETEDFVYNRQDFWATTSNKQVNFLQHIYTMLKNNGRAAVVVPDNVQPADLEASARRELRALGKVNAEKVSRHLVMTQRLLSTDPELAYQHARYAASHAGRVAVVRESAGIAAYLAGHYAEALREIRAARRLSGFDMHRAIEADCERALGRLQQALKVAKEADPHQLDDLEEAELAMVVSGVRHEMGQDDLGLVVIEEAIMMFRGDRETLRRLHSVRADRLEELGRQEEAAAVRERIGQGPRQETEDDHVQVYDIEDDYDQDQAAQTGSDASARSESSSSENLPVSDEDAPVGDQGGDLREEVPAGAPLGSDRIATTGDAAAGDRDDGADSEDSDESSSFEERVEAEMAELLSDVDDTQDQEA